MKYSHQDYVNFIQQAVDRVCPYEDERLKRLYHVGFLASYLARIMEHEPERVAMFRLQIERLTDLKN